MILDNCQFKISDGIVLICKDKYVLISIDKTAFNFFNKM